MISPHSPDAKRQILYCYSMIFIYHAVKQDAISNFSPALLLEGGGVRQKYVAYSDDPIRLRTPVKINTVTIPLSHYRGIITPLIFLQGNRKPDHWLNYNGIIQSIHQIVLRDSKPKKPSIHCFQM